MIHKYRVYSHPKIGHNPKANNPLEQRCPGFYAAWQHPDGRWLQIADGRLTVDEARFDAEWNATQCLETNPDFRYELDPEIYADPN